MSKYKQYNVSDLIYKKCKLEASVNTVLWNLLIYVERSD